MVLLQWIDLENKQTDKLNDSLHELEESIECAKITTKNDRALQRQPQTHYQIRMDLPSSEKSTRKPEDRRSYSGPESTPKFELYSSPLASKNLTPKLGLKTCHTYHSEDTYRKPLNFSKDYEVFKSNLKHSYGVPFNTVY